MQNLSPAQVQQLHTQQQNLVAALPLPIKDFQGLIAKMCFGKVKLNPTTVVSTVLPATGTTSGCGSQGSGNTQCDK